MWSICRYNVLNMTKMLLLGFVHKFGFKLLYGGQKMGTMTVFRPNNNFHLRFTNIEYWIIQHHIINNYIFIYITYQRLLKTLWQQLRKIQNTYLFFFPVNFFVFFFFRY